MFKKAFLLLGAMSLATSAMAVELTNPFYVPAKNTFASTTGYEFNTTTKNHRSDFRSKEYNQTVSEALSYGLTDDWSVDASISNTWQKYTALSYTDRDDKNVDFALGTTYNILSQGPVKVQSALAYGQKESNSHGNNGAYKYVSIGAKAGYEMGLYTPYVSGTAELPVFQSKDGDNEYKYETKLGLYTFCPKQKIAVDTGVRLNYDEYDESRVFAYDLEVSYYFTPKVAMSAYGSYSFNGKEHKTDIHGNALGLRLKTTF